ncbi:actinodefensin [Actinomyces wuliandei]|uniref:actinodefensin n=1 Tax=Actinomyces wuliandei TaxID=2057743 RepID=UPI000FD7FF29|nr:actinodefensin [Actinomyces wuliandei]
MPPFIRRTTALAGADFTQALRSETHAPVEGSESFPCLGHPARCVAHCRKVGFRGGYCVPIRRCVCY